MLQRIVNFFIDSIIRYRQIFSGGVSDQNEKLVGKFFVRLRRAKKGVPKFFACGLLFRCGGTEKPLETVKFSNKTSIFEEKVTPKFFRLRRAFFRNIGRDI